MAYGRFPRLIIGIYVDTSRTKSATNPTYHVCETKMPVLTLTEIEDVRSRYSWSRTTCVEVYSLEHGGWLTKLASDNLWFHEFGIMSRVMVKGPGVGRIEGFFHEGLLMEQAASRKVE